MNVSLSTLAITLGLVCAAPQVYGLLNPKGLGATARRFPRSTAAGVVLMILSTAWFLYNLSIESIADFASFKPHMMVAFAGIGLGTCVFVRDFIAVRGLAVLLLLLAKLMVDTGRPHLGHTAWVLLIQAWAYVFVIAGIWLTISPWRLRNWIEWNTSTERRTSAGCAVRLTFCLVVIVLGATVFRHP